MKNWQMIEKLGQARKLLDEVRDYAVQTCGDNENIRSSDDQYYDPTMDWCYETRDELKSAIERMEYTIGVIDNA